MAEEKKEEFIGVEILSKIPYNWSMGPYTGSLFIEMKENKKIWGIRCPKCKNTFEPIEFLDFDIYEDGEHDLDCPLCKHFFIVETTVAYSYESPAFVENPEEDF